MNRIKTGTREDIELEQKAEFIPNGKTAVVTGANCGIGLNTTLKLAEQGYGVTLACRDAGRAAGAMRLIMSRIPEAQIEFSLLDLSSLSSVQKFAERFLAANSKLDLLVNNAAVMAIPGRSLSEDGFEMQFATNHLGHFALTARLMPALINSAQARVVTVSSIAHKYGKLDFSDLHGESRYEGWSAYGTTKLANLLFAYEFARRAKECNLSLLSLAAHPGVSRTNILLSGPRMGAKVLRTYLSDVFAAFFAQSDSQGALPVIHACLDQNVRSGDYFGPDGFMEIRGKPVLVQSSQQSRDQALAETLWAKSEELTKLKLLSFTD